MDGLKLKKILIGNGYMLKDIAAKLGMTQPNFSQIIKAQDIQFTEEELDYIINYDIKYRMGDELNDSE